MEAERYRVFGQRVEELQAKSGKSWQRLSSDAHLSLGHIHRIRRGTATRLQYRSASRLGRALGLTGRDLTEFLAVIGYSPVGDLINRVAPSQKNEKGVLQAVDPMTTALALSAVLTTIDEIIDATAILLHAAAVDGPDRGPVWLTWFRADDLFEGSDNARAKLESGVQALLESGRTLRHLFPETSDEHKAVDLVADMLSRLGFPGLYEPRFVQGQEAENATYDLLVVPGLATLLVFTTKPLAGHLGLLLREEEQVTFFASTCDYLFSNAAPLLEPFPVSREGRQTFEASLTKVEESGQEKRLVKGGLTVNLLPEGIVEKQHSFLLGQVSDGVRDEAQELLNRLASERERRRKATRKRIFGSTTLFRDICPESALVSLAKTGIVPLGDWSASPHSLDPLEKPDLGEQILRASKSYHMELEDRKMVLRELLKWLTRDNYQLGLLDKKAAKRYTRVFWQSQGDVVLLQTWHTKSAGTQDRKQVEIDIAIKNSVVSAAFRTYCDEHIWPERTLQPHSNSQQEKGELRKLIWSLIDWIDEHARRQKITNCGSE